MIQLIDELSRLVNGRGGSVFVQTVRMRDLVAIVQDLETLGFCLKRANDLKELHLQKLVDHWRQQQLPNTRIHALLEALYWWSDKLERGHIFQHEEQPNGLFRIPRQFTNPAWSLSKENKLGNPRMQAALMLMEAFGLRLEEALMLRISPQTATRPNLAIRTDIAKRDAQRDIPILSPAQRNIMRDIGKLSEYSRLLPFNVPLDTYVLLTEREVKRSLLRPLLGLRMSYAQRRYVELTGQYCPLAGGPKQSFLRPDLRDKDRAARPQISAELGLTADETITTFLD